MNTSPSQILILLLFVGGPLLYPLFTRKWKWFVTSLIGYVLYILWGVMLHSTADISEYGTGYGLLVVPYILVVTVVGVIVQRND
ncbi:hypothetical protein ACFYKX_04275 [Cytobacillus sp. FJAT-54145]|uniref:Uncharacterized protein n=1 Tax=Cytobacillus spartinae TaxID=3299023 RepID=A0ABW6K7W9_9BACI